MHYNAINHNELHYLRNDYPLAPEKLEINENLQYYCFIIANQNGIKIGGVNKLVPNLDNKSKYVVHYRNLQLYLSLGMKLTRTHRVLKLKQSDWLMRFNDFDTDKRRNAANGFERHFFKLVVNGICGKTLENFKKRISVKLIENAKDYVKCRSKPIFVSQKTFSKNFVAIHEIKPVLTFNRPIYVGFSILDLSKYFIYKFHYKYIKNKVDAKFLFTNTENLEYQIKTEDKNL